MPQRERDVSVDTLKVELGARSYPILIGAGLLGSPQIFEQHLQAQELLIVSNTSVAPLYLPTLTSSLGSAAWSRSSSRTERSTRLSPTHQG